MTKRATSSLSKSPDREITRQFNGVTVPPAGTYHLDQAHTFITFAAQHMVVGHVRGRFASFSGR